MTRTREFSVLSLVALRRFAGASSAAAAGGFSAVPRGVFEGVAELSLGSAFSADAGGFGSVGGFDTPVAV